MDVASVVSLVLREIVRNNVVVDIIVVDVVVWLFGVLGGSVKFFQAERAYKHLITTFVQQKPYCSPLWRPLLDGSEAIQRTRTYFQAT